MYVTDEEPGFTREPFRKGFRYHDAAGNVIRDAAILRRIHSLVIPPAWQDVWICRHPKGHLQATGRDARNRKQYRYHPLYRAAREENKYGKLLLFGKVLPRIRHAVKEDLSLHGLPQRKVLATVVRLMDLAHIRVGNEEYARENHSYGLTTLRARHVEVRGGHLHFHFKGKSGQLQDIDLQDRRLAAIVKRCRDLPGYELFQYLDEDGARMPLESGMVNRYLRETTGQDVTAKDFRTWHGTVYAAEQLAACEAPTSATDTKKKMLEAVKAVAGRLGNRPATCRKHYIHPAVLDLYQAGELLRHMTAGEHESGLEGLDACERCVLKMLALGAPTNTRQPAH